MISSVYLIAVLGVVYCDDSNDAKIRYYYRNLSDFTELQISQSQQIFKKDWYNSSRTTVFFAHGFTGHPTGKAVEAVVRAYLARNDTNVALLNWEHLAASSSQANLPNSYLNWAAPNARLLGLRFADALLNLTAVGLDITKTYLIGHSLGAQLFGIAGNQLLHSGVQVPWIVGLDPAGATFEGRPLPQRLHSRSAKFVSVIHSDPSRYGFSRPLGTVDFWPNYRPVGPVRQPGCDNGPHPMFSPEDLCNHNRCWQLFLDAIENPGTLLGSQARNYRTWKNYSWKDRIANVLDIGAYFDKVVPGNYYFVTQDKAPYGLGLKGI